MEIKEKPRRGGVFRWEIYLMIQHESDRISGIFGKIHSLILLHSSEIFGYHRM